MKNKLLQILFLLFILVCFILLKGDFSNKNKFKIIKVIEADKFYVDFNNDNNPDSDELVRIADIVAFNPIKNQYNEKLANNLGLNIFDFMKAGYISRNWALKNLENKYIEITNLKTVNTKYNEYKFINAKLNNKDLAEILLLNGFAFNYDKHSSTQYLQAQNLKKTRENVISISKSDFLIFNKSTNVVHELTCPLAKEIHFGELILRKDIPKYNLSLCGYCSNQKESSVEDKFKFKSTRKYPKSVYKKFNEIELYLINPLEYKKPSSECPTLICNRIVSEIQSANKSIDVALYGISSQKDIFNALLDAKERGVKVRAVMDYSKNMNLIYKDSSDFINTFSAVVDKSEALMHNKFFIFDEKKVLLGSMNVSSSGSGGYNANIMAMINSSEVAKYYLMEFNQMYEGKFQQNKRKFELKPVYLSNSKIDIYFSPKSDIYKNAIHPLISNAKDYIFISIFYLTDKRIVDDLISAKRRGVEVAILWDALGAINFKNLFNELHLNNINLKAENWGGKNHEKTMLADNKLLIGSSNFSLSGFNKNDENMVLIENKEIADFYKDYFLYLFNSLDKKYSKYIPRAESLESINSCYDGIDNNFDGNKDNDDEGCQLRK